MSPEHSQSDLEAIRRSHFPLLTDERYALMNELKGIYDQAAKRIMAPHGPEGILYFGDWRAEFLATLAEPRDELYMIVLYHVIIGSTPPERVSCFDLPDQKLERYIRSLPNSETE